METNKIKSPGLREIKSFDKTEYKTLTPQEQESIAFYIERAKKADRSPDRSLQLDCVKSESLVIAGLS